MEDRQDLETLLLDGLPEREREHVIEAIDSTNAETLRRMRASGPDDASDGQPDEEPYT